jgi:hypothetical protein
MDSFEVTTTPADKALGYDTISTSSPDTKFVSLEAFRRKVIFFEPAATATKRACCSAGPRAECELTSALQAS